MSFHKKQRIILKVNSNKYYYLRKCIKYKFVQFNYNIDRNNLCTFNKFVC